MKKPTKYTCPDCGKENYEIGHTQEEVVFYKYDIETENYNEQEKYEAGESNSIWFCLDCDHNLTNEELELYNII